MSIRCRAPLRFAAGACGCERDRGRRTLRNWPRGSRVTGGAPSLGTSARIISHPAPRSTALHSDGSCRCFRAERRSCFASGPEWRTDASRQQWRHHRPPHVVAEMDPAEIDRVLSIISRASSTARAHQRDILSGVDQPVTSPPRSLCGSLRLPPPGRPSRSPLPICPFRILVALEEMRDRLTGDVGQVHDVVSLGRCAGDARCDADEMLRLVPPRPPSAASRSGASE